MADLRVTAVYDNDARRPGLLAGWGFSCWVEAGGLNLLFDTGADRVIEASNLAAIGLNPRRLDEVFLSHFHPDHFGGMTGILEAARPLKIFVGRSVPRSYTRRLEKSGGEVVRVEARGGLHDDILSTGEIGRDVPEQSLVVRSSKGLVVLTGCGHPGALRIAEKAMSMGADRIHLLLGGLHLRAASDEAIQEVARGLAEMEVRQVAPCHCTGERATDILHGHFGERCLAGGVGMIWEA